MFVDFVYELRRRGLKVGTQEALALARALSLDLHETTLDGLYDVARCVMVHRAEDLDAFDTAFAAYFEGVERESLAMTDELLSWLKDNEPQAKRRELTDEERQLLETLDLDEVRRRLAQRLAEQRERHDGGSRWIGTRGTSPFGRGGAHPSGIAVGNGPSGGKSALARAGAHRFRALRGDRVLDVRQVEVALRRLRNFVREGAPTELDLDETIGRTAKNAGELEVVLRAERRSSVKVLLLLDVGGSMDPYIELCERLFTAAKGARHWKQLEVYYFHNCLYGHVYPTTWLRDGVALPELLKRLDGNWMCIVVGDAQMHPVELMQRGGGWTDDAWSDLPGLGWMDLVARHFRRSAWLNPEPPSYWTGTAATLKALYPMFHLSLDGLDQMVAHLTGRSKRSAG
jgi:uncharacterized protein with von Willebrand factor type A (vWA) domain